MKNINEISTKDMKDIKMIVFDVDGVLVHRGSIIEQEENRITYEIKKIGTPEINLIKQLYKKGYIINISSGRSLSYLIEMFREVLPYVILTYENGSASWNKGNIIQHFNSFDHMIDIYKELSKVSHKNIKGWEPKEFIITIHCTDRVLEIEKIVSKYEDLCYIWNGEAYDIEHIDQTKADGLAKLLDNLNLGTANTIAIGDNFNDKELIDIAGIGVSSDYDRLNTDFYVPMPAGVMMSKILEICNGNK